MRYFLDVDEDSHWYVVQVDKRAEWEEWCGLDPDDEAAWDTPEFAERLPGGANWVTFENCLIEN